MDFHHSLLLSTNLWYHYGSDAEYGRFNLEVNMDFQLEPFVFEGNHFKLTIHGENSKFQCDIDRTLSMEEILDHVVRVTWSFRSTKKTPARVFRGKFVDLLHEILLDLDKFIGEKDKEVFDFFPLISPTKFDIKVDIHRIWLEAEVANASED